MVKLVSLLHEMNLDQARFYMTLDRTLANKVINPLWNYLKSQADYISRNGERLFFNFAGDKTLMTDISTLISSYEDPKGATYHVSNFKDGTVSKIIQTERGSKEVQMSLGKVLQMISKEEPEAKDLLDLYNRDMGARRASVSTDTPVIVISKHPVDIGNMTTDRGWSESCMRLPNAQDMEGGKNYKYIECDVKQGTLIAYYLDRGKNFESLKNATGRVLIKPYRKANTDELIMATGKVYGNAPQSFKEFIDTLLKSSKLYEVEGVFKLLPDLYPDGSPYLGKFSIPSNVYNIVRQALKRAKQEGPQDLTNLDIPGIVLSYKDLSGFKFQNSNLAYCNMMNTVLHGTQFQHTTLTGATLTNATLSMSNLSYVQAQDIDLIGADLTQANLSYTDLTSGNLSESNLTGAQLTQAVLLNTNLRESDLTGVDLSTVHIFKNVKLRGSTLIQSVLSRLDLTTIVDRDLSNVVLRGANLREAILSGMNLTVIRNKDMTRSILVGADLTGTVVTGLDVTGVNVKSTDLSKVIGLETCRGLDTLIWDENTKWPLGFNIEYYQ